MNNKTTGSRMYEVIYEPLIADGFRFGVFHLAGYEEAVLIEASDRLDARKKFSEGNNGRIISAYESQEAI